jgi:hypothetical protein
VDAVVATVDRALARQSLTTAAVERWKAEMPSEREMVPRDKYTMFDRKEKRYRKGVHSKWRISVLVSAGREGGTALEHGAFSSVGLLWEIC